MDNLHRKFDKIESVGVSYVDSIAHLLTKKMQQIKSVNEDKPWPHIVIDGVDMGIQTWDDNPSPYSMAHIINTLKTDNPWFCKGNLTDLRRILYLSLAKGNLK
jgi:hypothetical protein